MIFSSRNLLWFVPLLLFLSSPLWKPSVVRFLSPHGHGAVKRMGAVQADKSFTLSGVNLNRSENGVTEMILQADKVKSGKSGSMDNLSFEVVDIQLFNQGEKSTHITGGEGYYEANKHILTLIEDVVVFVQDKYELRSEALRYLIPYKTIKTAADIVFKSEDATVIGTGLSYRLTDGNYRVGGRVVCDIK